MNSIHTDTRPIRKLQVGWPLPIILVVSTFGFGFALRFLPVRVNLLVTLFVVVVGLTVGGTFVSRLSEQASWTHSEFATVRQRTLTARRARAKDLVGFEQMFERSTVYEHHLYMGLRPHLRYLARARLAARGIDLDSDPAAQELLGDLYELVHTRGAPPGALFGAGIPIELLETMVETLEHI
jgi:hypothetical protein